MAKDKWADIDELNKRLGFIGSDEGFTAQEYADRYNLKISTAAHRLHSLVRQGFMKAGWRMVIDTSGKHRRVRVYII